MGIGRGGNIAYVSFCIAFVVFLVVLFVNEIAVLFQFTMDVLVNLLFLLL
jgi:hypothetical protein